MLHEGKGFEGCGHLGTNFRNVHYTVEVDVEVSTIKEVIKTAEKNSIKYSSTKSLIVISNCLIRTWNRYAEKNYMFHQNALLVNSGAMESLHFLYKTCETQ